MVDDSRISGFYKLSIEERLKKKLGSEEIVGLTGIQDVINLLMTGV